VAEYTHVCNKCGATIVGKDRDELADKLVKHMQELHQEKISKLDAVNLISDRVRP
jgi:predicted small metal-binding protein